MVLHPPHTGGGEGTLDSLGSPGLSHHGRPAEGCCLAASNQCGFPLVWTVAACLGAALMPSVG